MPDLHSASLPAQLCNLSHFQESSCYLTIFQSSILNLPHIKTQTLIKSIIMSSLALIKLYHRCNLIKAIKRNIQTHTLCAQRTIKY